MRHVRVMLGANLFMAVLVCAMVTISGPPSAAVEQPAGPLEVLKAAE
jgi:hypothetical protein